MGKTKFFCSFFWIMIATALLVFTLKYLDPLLKSVIQDGIVMTPQTYDLWGANPGGTNTTTIRNYTFYNFTNPHGYLYHGQRPRFNEIQGYLYQERSNFTDLTYNQNQSIVSFNYWLYFTEMGETRNLSETVHLLNLAPLGFWSQLDLVNASTFTLQGFAGLFVEMNKTILMQAIGQGVQGTFLQTKQTFDLSVSISQFSQQLTEFLWTDPIYGLNDLNNYQIWVDCSLYENSDAQYVLYQYFGLEVKEMSALKKLFKEWSTTVNQILNNHYCDARSCTTYQLTLLQIGSSGVTNNTPPGNNPNIQSICMTGNITCEGYFPEIPAFLKHQFWKINSSKIYQELRFSTQTLQNLFTPYTGTFLNVGNLTDLFQIGQKYDSSTPKNQTYLEILKNMTHTESKEHAFVLWEYVKYFTNNFVLQKDKNGTRKKAGMAGIFTQALYGSFIEFGDWFLQEQLSILASQAISNCPQFIKKIIQNITSSRIEYICRNTYANDYKSYWNLLEPCNNEIHMQRFRVNNSFHIYEMAQLCDKEQESVLTILEQVHKQIHTKYKCTMSKSKKRCTKYELALMQFMNSSITLNPIESTVKTYPPSLSAKSWNPSLQQFEYKRFLEIVYLDMNKDEQPHNNLTQLIDLFSFDKLFSGPMVAGMLIEDNEQVFKSKYYWDNMTYLKDYVRYIIIEIAFGGYTTSHTIRQFVFGYEDQFLKTLRDMDPMQGGDPSINTIIAFNQPNSTKEQAKKYPQSMYSGSSNASLTRTYVSQHNLPYIIFNKTYYDGYVIQNQFINPFKQICPIFGTDAFQNQPDLSHQDSLFVYIDTLFRVGQIDFKEQTKKYDFDLYRYELSPLTMASEVDYPPNNIFYQGITGFMNMSFTGVPIFISKNHMRNSSHIWADMIEVYDESGLHKQEANQWDQTIVLIQPHSGTTFRATIYLQTNFYTQQDQLFQQTPRMMPLFSLYRSGNMTEDTANDLFGDLKFALAAPRKLFLLGVVILLTVVICFCAVTQNQERNVKKQSLLESEAHEMQDQDQEDKEEQRAEEQQLSRRMINQSSTE